jgi:hypothetical protein
MSIMFNLEQSISEWRRQLLAAGISSPVPLEELEMHLREDIGQLLNSGQNEAEAFKMAVQELGQARLLQNEFKKTGQAEYERKEEWTLRLVIAFMSLFALSLVAALLFRAGNMHQCSSSQQISCLVAVAIFSLPVWCVPLAWRIYPVIPVKRTRDAVGVLGGVFLAFWMIVLCRAIMPHFDFTMGQLMVVTFWAMIAPIGLLAGIAFGIETAARKKLKTAIS